MSTRRLCLLSAVLARGPRPRLPPALRPGGRAGDRVVRGLVDDDLAWVIAAHADWRTARAPSPAALVHLSVQLAQDLAAAQGAALETAFAEAELVDAAARAVAGYLDDLPDLPLVGEPFGGEEGTD